MPTRAILGAEVRIDTSAGPSYAFLVMRAKIRFNIILFLGLLFWILIFYDLYGHGLRLVLEEESITYLLNAAPGGPFLFLGGSLVAILFLIGFALLMNRHVLAETRGWRRKRPQHRLLNTLMGLVWLAVGCYVVWRYSPGPRPQELCGVIATVVGVSLFLFTFVHSGRRLFFSHLVFFIAAAVIALLILFAPGHREKVAVLENRLKSALNDLDAVRQISRSANPRAPIAAAKDRAGQFLIYRFDEHLGEIIPGAARENAAGAATVREPGTDTAEPPELTGDIAAIGYENIDDEIRKVLFAAAPCTLTYTVTVPVENPRVLFGVAAVDGDIPTTFEVKVRHLGRRRTIYSKTVTGPPQWSDHWLDFSRWAGQTVQVIFETTADTRTVGMWSNPVLLGEPTGLPNVVIYVNGGLRADHLGAYGYKRDTSPHFDRLTADGTLFEWAFSNGTATLNSIPGLFSSNPGASTGVRRQGDILPAAFPTLAEILRALGYATAAFTANPNTGIYSGANQGFSSIITPRRIAREAGKTGGASGVDPADARFVVDALVDSWLETNADRNFFLYVQTADCRGPYDPPEPYRRFYEKTESEQPVHRDPAYDPDWVKTPTRESRIGLYDGEIAYGDEYLRQFIDMLEKYGVLENTLIVYLSDHGEYFGEHGMWGHGPPAFVQGTRIPLLIVGPSFPPGVRIETDAQILDIMPTILDVLGMETYPYLFQGRSLVPVAQGEETAAFDARTVFVEGDRSGRLTFHCGDFHVIPERSLVFDLSEDPEEANSLNEFVLDFGLKSLSREVTGRYLTVYRGLGEAITSAGGRASADSADVSLRNGKGGVR